MKTISILVPENAMLGAIDGPYKVFTEVNNLLARQGRPPAFHVQLVGISKEVRLTNGLFTVSPELTIDEASTTDLLIIPAVYGDMQQVLAQNKPLYPWIVKQYKAGAEIASICIGAFLLASTGLLKGKHCATHWIAANDFRRMFPDVQLVDDKIITDEQGIYSSGGAYSHLNLMLYIVEKYVGRAEAVFCAKVLAIDIDRGSQSPFTIFHGQKDHADEPVKRAQEFIETNYAKRITVDELTRMLGMGRRNLERRFKKATSNTVVEYIQRVKVEAAKMRLESSRDNVNEVMYHVGYADPKAFRTVFKTVTGLSPIDYRNKYNRERAA